MIGFFHEVDPNKSGGKGKNLVELKNASFPVPPGFILTYDAYSRFKEANQIPGEMKELISTYYKELSRKTGSSMVAVRSSASAEDLQTASFAGLYDTYLYVNSEEKLFKRIVDCWHSLFSERATAYRKRMKVTETHPKMAVIVQTMVDPKSAGILFTTQPYQGKGKTNQKVMMVESNWGCGETVVAGTATPDRFVISKNQPYTILEKIPGEKEVFLQGSQSGPITKQTPPDRRRNLSLTHHELTRLCHLGNQMERHFAAPQDIEWALTNDGKIFILQSRPITKFS
ncbi:MAG: PEP/pyruvate-binding domain-containing protein [Candidatus Aminicenantes bacterium]|nr:MAG: PEP/pyruvate-binding domain-containing protein [Candidatus Aminicenantes bacterium]